VAAGLGQENGIGLTEYLRGEASYRDIIRPEEKEHLYVVFAGAPSGDSSELLSKPECKQSMDACRNTFDYIILDTPPAAMLSDASELGVLADGVLLTVRQNYASRRHIQEGAQILSDSGLPIIGCVMNYTPARRTSSGYYGYGYGYGYGYSYTYGDEEKPWYKRIFSKKKEHHHKHSHSSDKEA
jgi:Mrp family chromosome partitioning ATPase